MALSTEAVDLIRLDLLDDPDQIAVSEVASEPIEVALVRVLIEMIDPAGVEAA